ncbi:Rho termination factor N-terminal domain-containing protein [Mesorhizobium sp. B1-1-6]|uniref:Rho termination factor N-terminal domain-containing protein n=1 Tax=Mesorhizobium sp. B1-1-6 TaxID=2589978 RepID=UPI00112B46AB|nr:Rho termination factor N-terminal domain-containing protein [Mesorhizobium sp. B1-1-6]TPN34792.1 hypothetical protein FJ979_21645 [Mesorhizobium sp. B1-1-6]
MKTGKVTKTFPFAFDGINVQHLPEGSDFPPAGYSVTDSAFGGLVASGYIEESKSGVPEAEQLNRDIIEAFDRKISAVSDEELKAIIARSGKPYSGNLVHAHLVFAAKQQMLRELQGATPIFSIDPNAGVTEQPLAKPGEATPPSAAAAVEKQKAEVEAANAAGENKATNQFGDPLPAGGAKPTAEAEVDLESLKKDELEKLAADRGVDISSAKTKADIIEAINAGKSA